jgi:hypothetical protein
MIASHQEDNCDYFQCRCILIVTKLVCHSISRSALRHGGQEWSTTSTDSGGGAVVRVIVYHRVPISSLWLYSQRYRFDALCSQVSHATQRFLPCNQQSTSSCTNAISTPFTSDNTREFCGVRSIGRSISGSTTSRSGSPKFIRQYDKVCCSKMRKKLFQMMV